jgi:hypothetical protein
MNELGVPKERCHVWNEAGIGKEDYFGFNYRYVTNGFCYHGVDMSEAVENTKDWVMVSGSFGGEMTSYPCYKPRLHNRWQDLLQYFPQPTSGFTQPYHNFKDVFFPYLYKHYMKTVWRFDEALFKKDDIRDGLLGKMDTPCYYDHNYNLKISPERKKKIEYLYDNSKFYERYKHVPEVKYAKPWDHFYESGNLDSRLFGLAMTYEEGKI